MTKSRSLRAAATAAASTVMILGCIGSAQAARPGGGGGDYNPEIAYTGNQGSSWSLYVANADGTNAVAVFSQKAGVGKVDFVPGSNSSGGRLVFGDTLGSLSVLTYTAGTNGVTRTDLRKLVTESRAIYYIDVSPDGQYVLYGVGDGNNTDALKVIPLAGGTPITIAAGTTIYSAVWSRDLSRIAVLDPMYRQGGTQQIKMLSLDANFQITSSQVIHTACTTCSISTIEFARTRDSVIFSVGSSTSIDMYEVDANAPASAATPYGAGGDPCFDSSDSKILYRNSDARLYVLDLAGGTRKQVTASGSNQFDFRP